MNIALDLSDPQISGEDIKEARKELGWSREYLGGVLGVSAASIYAWEAGVRKASPANKGKIFALFKFINKFNQDQKKNGEQ